MLFSQRNGYKKVRDIIQIESIDEETRNRLWNALYSVYWKKIDRPDYFHHPSNSDIYELCVKLWDNYFKAPLDTLNHKWNNVYDDISKHFFSCQWHEVYDFIEFIPQTYMNSYGSSNVEFISICNIIFEQENCGYRFVDGKITEITSPVEIAEIETAINNSFKTVSEHLHRSLELMSDRKSPDYRNSIKESISAVESMCQIISDNPKATLADALKKLEKTIDFHSALKEAFIKIYGYTNDSDGIRHALSDDPNLKYGDAKFMLVSCSAFINYLKIKAEEAKIKIQ